MKPITNSQASHVDYLVPAGLGVLFVIFFRHYIWGGYIDVDSAYYSAIGYHLEEGVKLYRDIWASKPPGIYTLNAIALGFLGIGQESIWTLQMIVGCLQVFVFYRILRKLETSVWLSAAGTLVYMSVAYFSQLYTGGNFTEEYANLFVLLGVSQAVKWYGDYRNRDLMGAMFFLSISTLFKEPYLFTILPWILFLVVTSMQNRDYKNVGLIILALALPYVGLLAFLMFTGSLDAYWKHMVYNMEYARFLQRSLVDKLNSTWISSMSFWKYRLTGVPFLLLVGVFGIAATARRQKVIWFVSLMCFVCSWLGTAISGYNFQHYFLQFIGPLILAVTLSLQVIWRKVLYVSEQRKFYIGTGATILLLVCGFLIYGTSYGQRNTGQENLESKAIKEYIVNHKRETSTLFVEDVTNCGLYIQTQVTSKQTIPVTFFHFFMVPDKYCDERITHFIKSLKDQPPEFIASGPVDGILTRHSDILKWFTDEYVEVFQDTSEDRMRVYQRKQLLVGNNSTTPGD